MDRDDSSDDEPRKRRRTKESAMLGVFGSDEEELPRVKRTFVGFQPATRSSPDRDVAPEAPMPEPKSRPSAFGASKSSSFAARMMAKMGYKEGQGLGKEGQGRSHIVEVVARPQGVGLGAVRERPRETEKREKREKPKEKRERKEKRKTKYTVAELQAVGLEIPKSFLVSHVSESKPLKAEHDLNAFVGEWQHLVERLAEIESELAVTHDEVEEVDTFDLGVAINNNDWDAVSAALLRLDTLAVNVSTLEVAAILPFFRQALEQWDPLEDPTAGMADFLKQLQQLKRRGRKVTPYESMLLSVWLPKVRAAINRWHVYDSSLIGLVEAWELPKIVKVQVDQLIVRKLHDAVGQWHSRDPLPHLWLFPWLPYLPAGHLDPQGTGIVGDMRRKFRSLVATWDFSRLMPGLEQWKELFGASWQPFVVSTLVPALARYFRQFRVSPDDQEPYLKYLEAIKWKSIVGESTMRQILVDTVFVEWREVLRQWLESPGVNYEEVGQWMEWWRTLFDVNLDSEWARGLELINNALDGVHEQPAPEPELPAAPVEVTFRSIVEDFAAEHDLQFLPEQRLDAGPVYRVTDAINGKGGVLVSLRGDVLWVHERGGMRPLELGDELVQLASKRS